MAVAMNNDNFRIVFATGVVVGLVTFILYHLPTIIEMVRGW
jgi:hypothetical protein